MDKPLYIKLLPPIWHKRSSASRGHLRVANIYCSSEASQPNVGFFVFPQITPSFPVDLLLIFWQTRPPCPPSAGQWMPRSISGHRTCPGAQDCTSLAAPITLPSLCALKEQLPSQTYSSSCPGISPQLFALMFFLPILLNLPRDNPKQGHFQEVTQNVMRSRISSFSSTFCTEIKMYFPVQCWLRSSLALRPGPSTR